MTKLSVNLNKVALLRNQRDIGIPSVIDSARTAIAAGAHGITVHPRPDQRHIRFSDVYELADMLTVEFNIEGNPFTGEYMRIVRKVKPNQATLVPDDPNANTSDHGWNLTENKERLVPIIKELNEMGIRVSLFMDPETTGIEIAKEIAADRVELYTEPYAKAFTANRKLDETLKQYSLATAFAQKIGLGVNAGHDLNLHNLEKYCDHCPATLEVSIGHALIADALEMGLHDTVKAYLEILNKTK